MATILLTGSHGYLGENLHRALADHGHQLTRLSHKPAGDSITFADLERAPASHDVIIHAGTCYGRKGESEAEIREANVAQPSLLLEYGARTHALFVNIDTALQPDLNTYARSKHEFRERLTSQHGLTYLNLILDHFYGPGDAESKFPTWLTRKLLFTQEQIPLSEGTQERNFIYIDDLVRTLVDLTTGKMIMRGVVRIEGPDTVRIRELATTICELTGQANERLEFGRLPQRTAGSEVAPAEAGTTLLKPSEPVIRLREGLQKLISAERQRSR